MNKKIGLHPRNKHKESYIFKDLIASHPKLSNFVQKNKFGTDSIDFSDPLAVMALNTALLKHFYNIKYWEIPKNYLCPPIPGRADYIHYVADLIGTAKNTIKVLDIGVGANCIYPLIANHEYGWSIIGSDIDNTALTNAAEIVKQNALESSITLREQTNKQKIFENIIKPDDFFHATICNPPFHSSLEEARQGNKKKNHNLGIKKNILNFGGQSNELWCEGGEINFSTKMIQESTQYKKNCQWFTTLVSKSTILPILYDELKKHGVTNIKTQDMEQGQKKSRILAWKFST